MNSRDPLSDRKRRELCVYCEGTTWPYVNNLKDYRYGVEGSFCLSRCINCGALIADPMPCESDIEGFYGSYYTHQASASPPAVLQKLWPLPRRRRMAEHNMTYYLPRGGGSLLEVGCGAGDRLLALYELGWSVVGQDTDPAAGRLVSDTGIPIARCALNECNFEPGSFDVVAMAHVIEHVRSPESLLRSSWELVAPGGRLVVIGPLATAFGRYIFGHHWFNYHVPFHVAIPGPISMACLAERIGIPRGTTATNVLFADVLVAASLETLLAAWGFRGRMTYALRVLLGALSQCVTTPLHKWRPSIGTEFVWAATKAL